MSTAVLVSPEERLVLLAEEVAELKRENGAVQRNYRAMALLVEERNVELDQARHFNVILFCHTERCNVLLSACKSVDSVLLPLRSKNHLLPL